MAGTCTLLRPGGTCQVCSAPVLLKVHVTCQPLVVQVPSAFTTAACPAPSKGAGDSSSAGAEQGASDGSRVGASVRRDTIGRLAAGCSGRAGSGRADSWLVSVPGKPLAGQRLLPGGQVLAAIVAKPCGQQRQNKEQTDE